MNIFSMPRRWSFLLVICLLASCRSERVAFDFGTRQNVPALDSGRVSLALKELPASGESGDAKSVAPQLISTALTQKTEISKAASPLPSDLTSLASTSVIAEARKKPASSLLQSLISPRRTHAAAATQVRPAVSGQGLGKILFFVLAAVFLVLAGLAFAVAAIFSIGFWAALGYVAAGIVVVLLLRALVKKMGRG